MRRIPIYFPPLPGESFDSWLLSYAARLHTELEDLTEALGIGSVFMGQPAAVVAVGVVFPTLVDWSRRPDCQPTRWRHCGDRCPATRWSRDAASDRAAWPGQPGRCVGHASARRVWPSRGSVVRRVAAPMVRRLPRAPPSPSFRLPGVRQTPATVDAALRPGTRAGQLLGIARSVSTAAASTVAAPRSPMARQNPLCPRWLWPPRAD